MNDEASTRGDRPKPTAKRRGRGDCGNVEDFDIPAAAAGIARVIRPHAEGSVPTAADGSRTGEVALNAGVSDDWSLTTHTWLTSVTGSGLGYLVGFQEIPVGRGQVIAPVKGRWQGVADLEHSIEFDASPLALVADGVAGPSALRTTIAMSKGATWVSHRSSEELIRAVELALQTRLATYGTCRDCGCATPPEHGGTWCHGCMQASGVVF